MKYSASNNIIKHAILLITLSAVSFFITNSTQLGPADYSEYWTAGNLYASNLNPYDHNLVLQFQQKHFKDIMAPIILWNPPIILPFLTFASFFNYQTFCFIWLLAILLAIAAAVLKIYCIHHELHNQNSRLPWFAFLFTFPPFFLTIYYGQLSAFLLLALCGFVLLRLDHKDFLAGACLSISLWKPHLLYLVYAAIFIEALQNRRFGILLGLSCGVLAQATLAYVLMPSIFEFYAASLSNPPIYWQTPTLGSMLQLATNLHTTLIRFTPTLITLPLFVIIYCYKKITLNLNTLGIIIALSLLTSPYGWQYDQMLLLISVFPIFFIAPKSILNFSFLLACNAIALFIPNDLGQHVNVWYPAAVLVTLSLQLKQPISTRPLLS